MRVLSRVVCTLFGHRPSGGQAVYDTGSGSFVDVAKTRYAVCTRCGDVRPSPLTIVDRDPDDGGKSGDGDESRRGDEDETAESAARDAGEQSEPDGDRDRAVTGTQ